MTLDWSTLILQTVNFAVLAWLLHRFLYKPVLRLVEARRADVEKQYAAAAAVQAKAETQLAGVEAARGALGREREQALKDAAAQADRLAEERRAASRKEAAELIEAAHHTITQERARARAETRNAALDLGIEIARRFLAEMPTELRAEGCLERIEQHIAALSQAERGELRDGSAAGSVVRIVTATTMPD